MMKGSGAAQASQANAPQRAACDTFGRAQENPVLQEATASEPLTIEVRIGGQRTILQHRLWPACASHRLSNSG